MSYIIGGVALPCGPSRVSKRNPAIIEEFQTEGLPVLIVPGYGAVELIIEGSLVGDKASIEASVLLPLEALKGTEVTVAFPGARYDGLWVLSSFDYVEVNAKKFSYAIKLLRGSASIIL
jgi:hypothetical protein